MNIDQLQLLKTIKEEGSFTKAGEKLGKAKSALTYAINSLEDEYGLPLIDRTNYRPELTRYGEQLLEKALPVLKSFLELQLFAKRLSQNQELKIKISMAALMPLSKLTKTLKDLEDKFPETEVFFTTEILSGEKLLFEGVVDISLLAGIYNRVDLEYKKITEVAMPLVIAKSHPVLLKTKIDSNTLKKYPQIIVRSTIPDSVSFGVLKDSKRWYVDDMSTKLNLILEGLGWGRLPEHIVNEYVQRDCLEIIKTKDMDHDKIEIFLARRKNDYHGVVSNYIWNSL